MFKRILTAVAATAVMSVGLAVAPAAATPATGDDIPAVSDSLATDAQAKDPVGRFPKMDPCPTEDSRNCTWDAKHQGDGNGRSYWARTSGKDVRYSHRVVHRLQHDTWRWAPRRLWGTEVDFIHHRAGDGHRTVTSETRWTVGDTTLFVWAGHDRVDYQVGTS